MNQPAIAITPDVLDAEACRTYWRGKFHPGGACCPRCHTCLTDQQSESWRDGGKVNCHSCGLWFTWRTGTPLSGKSIDACQLYLIASLRYLKLPHHTIAESCGISIDTVRRWIRRIEEGV